MVLYQPPAVFNFHGGSNVGGCRTTKQAVSDYFFDFDQLDREEEHEQSASPCQASTDPACERGLETMRVCRHPACSWPFQAGYLGVEWSPVPRGELAVSHAADGSGHGPDTPPRNGAPCSQSTTTPQKLSCERQLLLDSKRGVQLDAGEFSSQSRHGCKRRADERCGLDNSRDCTGDEGDWCVPPTSSMKHTDWCMLASMKEDDWCLPPSQPTSPQLATVTSLDDLNREAGEDDEWFVLPKDAAALDEEGASRQHLPDSAP
eukprot:gnl/TRDRNA2_/TRDRNA2_163519_c0_seq1.p1 gnl/TRDRNA2_/TRDRNA2_163519_c0~~gnl/TRDRNA2_/TRDRNA2_163519_c0_seq1.p1  ORF type:complete len:261 (-),score=36.14 gnl/TRDRNA2_/TRDRNA2_163519_c0_seq1:156-938(-)